MAVIEKNGNWWVDTYINGRRIRRKIGPEEETAKLAEMDLKVRAAKGEWLGIEQTKRMTFAEFFNKKFFPRLRRAPLTIRNYEKNARLYFIPAFGTTALERIRTEHVEDYVSRRTGETAPGTVKLELSQLKAILNAAIKWGYMSKNPAKGVVLERVPETPIRPLTVEQAKRLYEVAKGYKDWLYPFLAVALNTGMRLGEILNLRWKNVDFRRRQIAVVNEGNFTTKSGKNRYIPMTDFLAGVLSRHPKHISSPYVFPAVCYNKRPNLPLQVDVPRKRLREALEKAGLPTDFRVHDLRHTFGSRLAENREDPRTIMELMGHSDVSMTMRYIHTSTERKADAVSRLGFDDRPETEESGGDMDNIWTPGRKAVNR